MGWISFGRTDLRRTHQRSQCGDQGRSGFAQFTKVFRGKLFEQPLTAAGKVNLDLTAIPFPLDTLYQAAVGHPIDQFDRAVMLDLQPFGQIADGRAVGSGEAFRGQKKLVVLRLDVAEPGGLFAEMEKAADLIPKFRQGLIIVHTSIIS